MTPSDSGLSRGLMRGPSSSSSRHDGHVAYR